MITTSYSTVIDHRLDKTWALLRDFNNYPVYIEGVTDSVIEDARPGDEVAAVRRFCYGDEWSVSVDAAPAHADSWRRLLMQLIPEWTESLRRTLGRRA